MNIGVQYAIYYVLFFFWLALVTRLVVEVVKSFARHWRGPSGVAAGSLEVAFVVTDPPIKLLRKLIPPVRLGSVDLDLSITILFFVVFIAMRYAHAGL
ncbi:YggT family protein [Pseudonocardia spinosispora]|uniref:YggT family protein n=1 Tax=Pseudonocardia spinosispora TaxID=103441 RepID=UPI00041DC218|nr:YggT family protein [Pseudonocardia spinosispora]